MKTSLPAIITLLSVTLSGCIGCKKEITDPNGLPAATQEGKNTLGFLLNGQPWTPKGSNGTANLSIDVDLNLNKGIFSLSAYKIVSENNREYFGIGLKDSLNLINPPQTYQLGNATLYGVYYSNSVCTFNYFDNMILRSGSLTITRFDKGSHILSGTFNAVLSQGTCETIRIDEGRFDMKF